MRRILIVLALLLLWIAPAAADTLLLYMIGGDLERDSGAASADVSELLMAPAHEGLDVVVLTGGSPLWYLKELSGEGAAVSRVNCGQLQHLAGWPDASCGDPDTLARFLSEYAEPGGNTMLILWGHGHSGLNGIGPDLLHGNDLLTLPEIVQALSRQ